jgi:hypothetical protein
VQELFVQKSFRAPASDVFAAVSDHERFLRNHGITRCVVTRPGGGEKNGLGAIREVAAGPLRFTEEIVSFDPPHRYDYKIRSVELFGRPFPMEHELGWVEVIDAGDHVEVDWRSRFTLRLPLIGTLLGRGVGQSLEKTFRLLLDQAQQDLHA